MGQGKQVDIDLAVSDDVWSFLKNGGQVNDFDWDGETPLMIAVLQQDLPLFRYLTENGADVNAKNAWGETALMKAAQETDKEWIDRLLEKGALLNVRDMAGQTALMKAVRAQNRSAVQALTAAGADLNEQNEKGETALMMACFQRNADIVAELLKYKPATDLKDKKGQTALMHYFSGSDLGSDQSGQTAFLLMRAGADLSVSDRQGESIFVKACKGKFYDFACEILNRNAVRIQTLQDEHILMQFASLDSRTEELLNQKFKERREMIRRNRKSFLKRIFLKCFHQHTRG